MLYLQRLTIVCLNLQRSLPQLPCRLFIIHPRSCRWSCILLFSPSLFFAAFLAAARVASAVRARARLSLRATTVLRHDFLLVMEVFFNCCSLPTPEATTTPAATTTPEATTTPAA